MAASGVRVSSRRLRLCADIFSSSSSLLFSRLLLPRERNMISIRDIGRFGIIISFRPSPPSSPGGNTCPPAGSAAGRRLEEEARGPLKKPRAAGKRTSTVFAPRRPRHYPTDSGAAVRYPLAGCGPNNSLFFGPNNVTSTWPARFPSQLSCLVQSTLISCSKQLRNSSCSRSETSFVCGRH